MEMSVPKTKEMVSILKALGVERSALIALASPDTNVVKSVSAIRKTEAIQARQLNVVDLLSYRDLILTSDAVRIVENLWGTKAPSAA